MSIFAAATAPKNIPPDFWVKLGIGIVAIVIVVVVLRKVAKMNKVILTIVVLLGLSIVGFNWIYERNEPAWATPVVQWLAEYFPTKGAVKAGPASGVR